jgi:Ca2+-binding EF-hand superfamily protein
MRICLFAAIAALAVPATVAAQPRGRVNAVRATTATNSSTAEFVVTGRNPCGAVFLDYGDGEGVTHPIVRLPVTLRYDYPQAGTYRVTARGQGDCDGQATTSVRVVTAVAAVGSAGTMRFAGMDRNNDGVITRQEWRGSPRSFAVHDWDGNGALSGNEVRQGANRGGTGDVGFGDESYSDWTRAGFRALDHDDNSRITLEEWHFDIADFRRADRNRDNVLVIAEFLGTDFDDDRGDRFDDLDLNNNGRLERGEWHSTLAAFEWLDRNNDGWLSRIELDGEARDSLDLFDSLDMNRNGTVSLSEWHWSRQSFTQRDRNGDGMLSRSEVGAVDEGAGSSNTVVVPAAERWTTTRVVVRAGDLLTFDATGTVGLSITKTDLADPEGSRTGRLAANAPLPGAPAGALIGRVGNDEPFLVGGATRTFRAANAGVLYLGINDDHLPDNRGEFRVVVTVIGR